MQFEVLQYTLDNLLIIELSIVEKMYFKFMWIFELISRPNCGWWQASSTLSIHPQHLVMLLIAMS